MIDTKAIRAGNWVMANDYGENMAKPQPVYKVVQEDEYSFTFARQYFPIPLSAEILANSSFRHSFGNWFKNLGAEGIEEGLPFLRFNLKANQWYLFEKRLPFQPTYLHQLQNLYYALTNKELVINLQQMPANRKQSEVVLHHKPFFTKGSS